MEEGCRSRPRVHRLAAEVASEIGKPRQRVEDKFDILEQIGVPGSSAIVYMAKDRCSQAKMAVKISKEVPDHTTAVMFWAEVGALRMMQHPNIVKFQGLFLHGAKDCRWAISMELVEAPELRELILKDGSFTESEGLQIASQLLSAVRHMHSVHVVHRDLKLDNVLVSSRGCVKVIDFGIACLDTDQREMGNRCGSVGYVAPEVLNKSSKQPVVLSITNKIDCFSCGCILHAVFMDRLPFNGKTLQDTLRKNRSAKLHEGHRFRRLKLGTQELLRGLMCKEAEGRLSSEVAADLASCQSMQEQQLKRPILEAANESDTSLSSEHVKDSKRTSDSSVCVRRCNSCSSLEGLEGPKLCPEGPEVGPEGPEVGPEGPERDSWQSCFSENGITELTGDLDVNAVEPCLSHSAGH